MIIIGFSNKTSKKLPRLVCRHFYHCAIIIPQGKMLIMYQFTRPGQIAHIRLTPRDIRILQRHGWCFIYIDGDAQRDFDKTNVHTCVHLAKRALNIHARHIQTPYALYRYIRKKHAS